ncbi:MAG: DUF502 domain-containing protein [Planctomycetes bacterium]|nr:DUF502 domain-containing protein [Planctomycetota bacterium]MCB9936160.1 DUF502 domain-containing protein [Planctomycetota bacterium]
MSKPRRKTGPITRAFIKGLSIILPAVITIAIFAWVWDILRVYVVELTIQGIDSIKPYDARKLSQEELDYLPDGFFVGNGSEGAAGIAVIHSEITLKRVPRVIDLPDKYQGLTPPGKPRSVLQYVLDANGWQRTYDPVSGRVVAYNWFDYLLASVLGLTLVVLLGFLARNFFGRKFVALLEWFVTKVPVIRSIYPHAKQLVEFFFSDNKAIEFDTVAVIEYPRFGLWSIAFVTGSGLKTVQEATGKRMVTVYVPSSPAPMTGYCMIMPAEDVIQVDITVEEAMKFVISGGVLAPKEEQVRPASGPQYALTHTINEQIRKRQTAILQKSQALKKIEEEVAGNGEEPETREVDAPGEQAKSD